MSEPLPEQPPVEPAVEPAEPEWSGPSREEWEQTQAQLQQYAQMLQPQPPQPQYGYPQEPTVPNPLYSENYEEEMKAWVAYQTQSFQQLEQEVRLSQAEEFAHSHLDELAQQGGEFDRDAAYARANMILMQQGGDPVQALNQAAKEVREYEQRVGQAFYDRQIEQLQTNAGAPRGLPAGGVGAAQTVPTGGLGNHPHAVTRKFFGPN